MTPQEYSCLGFHILGACNYNPSQPSPVYFSIGNAISALGFTFAVQQFLKPIYRFRINANGLRLLYLYAAVFGGFLCTVFAAVLPNLGLSFDYGIEYPIVWEIIGGLLIGSAYGVAAFISLNAPRVRMYNLLAYIRAGAALLSAADDSTRADFAEDFLRRQDVFKTFVFFAEALERARRHAARIELGRLRAISPPGASFSIPAQQAPSAFYIFAHRRELEAGTHAVRFLQIISDPEFCAALVRRCPWLTAAFLERLGRDKLHSQYADNFVQEIARQALVQDESIVTKEVSYGGFAAVPALSNSLFSNWYMLTTYNPLGKMLFKTVNEPSEGYVRRLNGAAELMLTTAIENQDYYPQRYMHVLEGVYENQSRDFMFRRSQHKQSEYLWLFLSGTHDLYGLLERNLKAMDDASYNSMFITKVGERRSDLADVIASIVYDSIEAISNGFMGVEDQAWSHAIDLTMDIFPSIGEAPSGMHPLQQQLAIKILDKLRDNMRGLYPAICRVLLAVIGPYNQPNQQTNQTAFVLFKDMVYRELQNLPALYDKEPGRVPDYLPPSVTYDRPSNSLTFNWRRGPSAVTDLSAISPPLIDLTEQANWTPRDAL